MQCADCGRGLLAEKLDGDSGVCSVHAERAAAAAACSLPRSTVADAKLIEDE